MLFKRNKLITVPATELTDYSERFAEFEKMREEDRKFASRKDLVVASAVPVAASVGFAGYQMLKDTPSTIISEPVNVMSAQPIVEPTQLVEAYTPLAVNTIPQPTGIIADKSLEILATALDPIVQILVAISFPVASVIMIGACFFFMFGNSEKAWSMIMNAGLGYVLIQLSPLFLEILKAVGSAV